MCRFIFIETYLFYLVATKEFGGIQSILSTQKSSKIKYYRVCIAKKNIYIYIEEKALVHNIKDSS